MAILPALPVPNVTLNWGPLLNDYLFTLNSYLTEPAGMIKPYAGTTAPARHAMCDGSNVPRTGVYAPLFQAIGTKYGVGDGSTTFTLPNLKGRLLVGIDTSQPEFDPSVQGMYGGTKTHTLTSSEIPSHTHDMSHDHGWSGSFTTYLTSYLGPQLAVDYPTPDLNEVLGDPLNTSFGTVGVSGDVHTLWASTGGAGGGLAHTNLMPYGLTNYIITLGQ